MNNENKTNINWYPGHMKKTKDEIKKIMPVIDIVFEIIDARIPLSKDIDDITRNKDKILIMSSAFDFPSLYLPKSEIQI